MKLFTNIFLCLALAASAAFAGSIDGKWVSERKMERDGQSMTITQTFDLKSDGNKLMGSIAMTMGDQEPRKSEITDGKIDGESFSFSAVMSTPNGEMKTTYTGKVDGSMLKGESMRDGGQGRPFEAKKK